MSCCRRTETPVHASTHWTEWQTAVCNDEQYTRPTYQKYQVQAVHCVIGDILSRKWPNFILNKGNEIRTIKIQAVCEATTVEYSAWACWVSQVTRYTQFSRITIRATSFIMALKQKQTPLFCQLFMTKISYSIRFRCL